MDKFWIFCYFFFIFFFIFFVFINGDSSYKFLNYSEIIGNNIYVMIFSSSNSLFGTKFEDSDFTYYKKNRHIY